MSEHIYPVFPDKKGQPPLLVWVGPAFFSQQLHKFGWELCHVDHDLGHVRDWTDILSITSGRIPDVLLVADGSVPPHVVGVEGFPCLTVFYAVDTHIHSWYPLYAQAFDVCLVSLRDHMPLFMEKRIPMSHVWWSPPYAPDTARPPAIPPAPEWELLFLGTVDPVRTPERHIFLQEVKERLPQLQIMQGPFPELFPKALLALNEASAGDLNFRVFEALGCGVCLLTPLVSHGLTDLFSNGTDLFTYPQHDVAAVVELTNRLLKDNTLRRLVAQNGLHAIDSAHRATHRASSFTERMAPLLAKDGPRNIIKKRLAESAVIHSRYLKLLYLHHAETTPLPALQKAYLKASRQAGSTSHKKTM